MSEFEEAAVERLNKECKEITGEREIVAMKEPTRDALIEFCRQDGEFAQAVAQGGSFSDCMKAVAKGVNGSAISDIEAYRRAVAFYFPGADIHFDMWIDLCASVGGSEPDKQKNGVLISLDSFFE